MFLWDPHRVIYLVVEEEEKEEEPNFVYVFYTR